MIVYFDHYLRIFLSCFLLLSVTTDFAVIDQKAKLIDQDYPHTDYWVNIFIPGNEKYVGSSIYSEYVNVITSALSLQLSSVQKSDPETEVNTPSIINPARAMTLKFKPWEIVTSLIWSPDGQYFLISAGNGIFIFDADTLNQLGRIEIGSFTRTLNFSHSGEYFAAGSRDGRIRVWKFEPPDDDGSVENLHKLLLDMAAHKNGVNKILFNAQDNAIISAGNDGLIKIWDVASGENRSTIIGGNRSIPGIAMEQNSSNIAILNGDFIRIRDYATTLIWGTIRSPEYLLDILYSPDDRLLISSSISNRIYLWDPNEALRSGIEAYPEPIVLNGHRGKSGTYNALVWDVELHPSGDYFASAGGDGQLIFWNLDTKQSIYVYFDNGIAITCIAFSPDGDKIMAGRINGVVQIWAVSELIITE